MSEIVYDENFIKNYLKNTIEEIDVPFIERRINSGGHKENLQGNQINLYCYHHDFNLTIM